MKYRIKPNLAYRKIFDEIYIVDSKNSYLHKINEVGSFIFEKLKEGLNEDEIIDELVKTYDVEIEVAKSDYKNFIEEIFLKGLIEKDAKK
ncbi:MAG: PqqD family protein [Candidatus Omnitrophica bacterium]|nr:PqqD family protein [Candidatus Omnitrophota bacterium]